MKNFSQNFVISAFYSVVGSERKIRGLGNLPNKQNAGHFRKWVPFSYACYSVFTATNYERTGKERKQETADFQVKQRNPANETVTYKIGGTYFLESPEYTGCTVNFKTYSKSHKLKKRLQNAPENYRIFPNTQPAIIEEKVFERVQELRANKRRPTKTGKQGLFSGLLYCADCGKKLCFCTTNSFSLN